jgi:hypothetical protein
MIDELINDRGYIAPELYEEKEYANFYFYLFFFYFMFLFYYILFYFSIKFLRQIRHICCGVYIVLYDNRY